MVGVGGAEAIGGGRGTPGGTEQPALVWVRGNGRHRGDGLPAGAQHHGSFVWAAAAHGWVSNHYTEHLQTDKKKQTHWAQMETSAFLLFPIFLLVLCLRVSLEEGQGDCWPLRSLPTPSPPAIPSL